MNTNQRNWESNTGKGKRLAEQRRLANIEEKRKAERRAGFGKLQEGDAGYTTVGGGINEIDRDRPDFLTMRDTEGNLADRFTQTMGQSHTALRDKAMAEGDSAAAAMQREQMQNAYRDQTNRLGQQQGSQLAQARSGMAMRGGIGSGARERLAAQGMQQGMAAQQGLGRNLANQNLNISMQDEQMKNQILQGMGGVENAMQRQNIDRLGQDISGQNTFMATNYGEDMKAYAAQKSAAASRPAPSCFLADTKVVMANGVEKSIIDVRLGDEVAGGGIVDFKTESVTKDLYRYGEDFVTGSHAVLEDGKFLRVEDSKKSIRVEGKFYVYCIGNEKHRILTPTTVYADFFEDDDYDNLTMKQSIEKLNETLD